MAILYLTNSFPEAVESYVWEEIRELRSHGATVISCSIRQPAHPPCEGANFARETRYIFPLEPWICLKATGVLLSRLWGIRDLIRHAILGPESWSRKIRTLVHTWFGAYLAVLLTGRNVEHIHVRHGYFSSWIGMIAARIRGASFSITLHGSDLLVRGDYIDVKLAECCFCFTISDFNRKRRKTTQKPISMRILYCNKYNYRFSGTESYLFDAMEGMRACGHQVVLFSMSDPRGPATEYDQHLVPPTNFKSARGVITKARLAAQAIYSVTARTKMRAMIKEFRPDVAHVRNIYHHLSPSILWELKAHGVPILLHVNDFKILCPTYNMVNASGEACERCAGGNFKSAVIDGCYFGGRAAGSVLAVEAYLYRWFKTYEKCVDMLLAPSQFVMNKFVQSGWHPSRIQVLQHFQDLPARMQTHPGRRAPILYLGRLSPEKGVSDLVSAMAQLPHVQLVIAGEGPQRRDLERVASSSGLRNITFAGQLSGEELQRLIATSQFTVFPSRAYETFGKSILESYAQARAVVASDMGSRRELVREAETGILYKPGNVDELAATIRLLHDRPELSKRMGEAGWELVRDEHSQVKHFLALQQIYQHLTEKSPSKAMPRTKPLRVAFIGGRGVVSKYSGVETCNEQTGARLAAKGHEITVYCRSYFTPRMTEHNAMRIVRLTTIRTKHLDTFVHTLLSTAHVCFSDCEIVHYQTLGPSLFSFVPRLFGKKPW